MSDPERWTTSIRLGSELRHRLAEAEEKTNVPRNQLIQRAVRKYLDDLGE